MEVPVPHIFFLKYGMYLGPRWLRWHHRLSGLGPQGLKFEPPHVENNLDTMCI